MTRVEESDMARVLSLTEESVRMIREHRDDFRDYQSEVAAVLRHAAQVEQSISQVAPSIRLIAESVTTLKEGLVGAQSILIKLLSLMIFFFGLTMLVVLLRGVEFEINLFGQGLKSRGSGAAPNLPTVEQLQ